MEVIGQMRHRRIDSGCVKVNSHEVTQICQGIRQPTSCHYQFLRDKVVTPILGMSRREPLSQFVSQIRSVGDKIVKLHLKIIHAVRKSQIQHSSQQRILAAFNINLQQINVFNVQFSPDSVNVPKCPQSQSRLRNPRDRNWMHQRNRSARAVHQPHQVHN